MFIERILFHTTIATRSPFICSKDNVTYAPSLNDRRFYAGFCYRSGEWDLSGHAWMVDVMRECGNLSHRRTRTLQALPLSDSFVRGTIVISDDQAATVIFIGNKYVCLKPRPNNLFDVSHCVVKFSLFDSSFQLNTFMS